jgi:hypothetical protein
VKQAVKSSRARHAAPVEPMLGWTYLSRDALARAKAQMDEESLGVRDEVGFLTIHQRYADHFFPGTSVLHKRARYTIFVPWLFEDLAGFVGPAATRALHERERVLAGRLSRIGEAQVIGGRVYPNPSSQPPSTVYWNALAVWGRTISRSQAHYQIKSMRGGTDDDGQPLIHATPPFVTLPERPSAWHDGALTLRLTPAEAAFLRERLGQLRRHSSHELSLLARLIRAEAAPPPGMWADEVRALAGSDRSLLVRAQQAASLAGVGRAVYDALLERLCETQDRREVSARHRNHLADMVEKYGANALELDVSALEADVGALPTKLRSVLTATQEWIASKSANPEPLLDAYTLAEERKGPRARLAPTPNGRARRLEWLSDEHALAAPLHYRWEQVSTFLNDLASAE